MIITDQAIHLHLRDVILIRIPGQLCPFHQDAPNRCLQLRIIGQLACDGLKQGIILCQQEFYRLVQTGACPRFGQPSHQLPCIFINQLTDTAHEKRITHTSQTEIPGIYRVFRGARAEKASMQMLVTGIETSMEQGVHLQIQ